MKKKMPLRIKMRLWNFTTFISLALFPASIAIGTSALTEAHFLQGVLFLAISAVSFLVLMVCQYNYSIYQQILKKRSMANKSSKENICQKVS